MSTKQKVTPYRNIDLDETGVIVSASPVKVALWYLFNNSAAKLYVKFYDKATAATNADTPKLTIPVPAGSGANLNLCQREVPFSTGLSLRCTTGIADNDTGAPAANDMVVNLGTIENTDYTF